jgi:hypothetical protein
MAYDEGARMSRTFYRAVLTNPPELDDFKSYVELGKAQLEDAPGADGVSVYATFAQARRIARILRPPCEFVAQLDIPDDAPVRIEPGRRGHHNLYAPADQLKDYVVEINPAAT